MREDEEEQRIIKIKEHAEIELKMLDEYGGDNLPTKLARADAQTKLNFANYILGDRQR